MKIGIKAKTSEKISIQHQKQQHATTVANPVV
jgi:hypothetical protein